MPADANVEIYAGKRIWYYQPRRRDPKALGTIEPLRWYKLNLTFTRSVSPVTVFTASEQLSRLLLKTDVLIETFGTSSKTRSWPTTSVTRVLTTGSGRSPVQLQAQQQRHL